jgi:hypothetical protein
VLERYRRVVRGLLEDLDGVVEDADSERACDACANLRWQLELDVRLRRSLRYRVRMSACEREFVEPTLDAMLETLRGAARGPRSSDVVMLRAFDAVLCEALCRLEPFGDSAPDVH